MRGNQIAELLAMIQALEARIKKLEAIIKKRRK